MYVCMCGVCVCMCGVCGVCVCVDVMFSSLNVCRRRFEVDSARFMLLQVNLSATPHQMGQDESSPLFF